MKTGVTTSGFHCALPAYVLAADFDSLAMLFLEKLQIWFTDITVFSLIEPNAIVEATNNRNLGEEIRYVGRLSLGTGKIPNNFLA